MGPVKSVNYCDKALLLAEVIDFAYAQNFSYHIMENEKQSESVS